MSNAEVIQWFGFGAGTAAVLSAASIAFEAIRNVITKVANSS